MLDVSVIVPTYFSGKIIENLFKSLPSVKEVLVLDNSSDQTLKKLISEKFDFITYIDVGDIGLAKTFNYALKKSKSENIFITQPDVTIGHKSLDYLLEAKTKYINAAILSPFVFEEDKYAYYDSPELKMDKDNFLIEVKKKDIEKNTILPDHDIIVDSVTSTAILIDKKIILKLGGWDEFYYTYMEDIDLSFNVRKNGYQILKIKKATAQHKPFSSHNSQLHNKINLKRIENFTKSSIYFKKKHSKRINFYIYFYSNLMKVLFKVLFNFIFIRKKKFLENILKLKQFLFFI